MRKRGAGDNRDALSKAILLGAENSYRQKSIATFLFVAAALSAAYGLANLTVENRFIDYFKSDTEIYQGMHEIDEKLGGTTPLDIIIDAPQSFFEEREAREERRAERLAVASQNSDGDAPDWDDFDDFEASVSEESSANEAGYDDDFEESLGRAAAIPDDDFDDFDLSTNSSSNSDGNLAFSSYWYNEDGISKLKAIHDDLENFAETGKVLSLATSMSIFENLKDAGPMDDIDLGFMYNVLSDEIKDTLFVPYLSADGNQTHISIRVFESHKGLDRNQLIKDIRTLLVEKHGMQDEQVKISGMLVLYNNMLNSLFNSQILTLGTVFLAIMLMFWVLFRSFKLALITIIPNIFSAGVVLGIMGIFSIPLDLMTITIAAITVGIAVDNAIHYVSRYRDERLASKSAPEAIDLAKNNVGQAMFYTTLTITAGFLIMVFSNFVPTMYFGILTALAMVTALIANLVMLPMLLERFKP
jgi:predicted RND superfamily exporter protein